MSLRRPFVSSARQAEGLNRLTVPPGSRMVKGDAHNDGVFPLGRTVSSRTYSRSLASLSAMNRTAAVMRPSDGCRRVQNQYDLQVSNHAADTQPVSKTWFSSIVRAASTGVRGDTRAGSWFC
jgi:hypothetical protein